jgi:formyltetrahydrofolate-dependent phosphoribosylglycinamide formyltransferase
MFERLQKKWKVNGLQLVLILCTFAIGGSLTGYVGRKLMNTFAIGSGGLWIVVYIILITLLWPMAVLLVSIPFGQFRFFTGYLKKMGRRIGFSRQPAASSQQPGDKSAGHLSTAPGSYRNQLPAELAIFASGGGSNAEKIIEYFKNSSSVHIALIVSNKPDAGVLKIAAREKIPVLLIEKERFFRGDAYIPELKKYRISFIILAGFLWKIPEMLIWEWHGKIVNIHPALLPAYGGKGMYGSFVHEAVLAAREKESGITIHYVDDQYDHGATIFQARCPVYENDTAASLAQRIHMLEHEHYPKVIEKWIKELKI